MKLKSFDKYIKTRLNKDEIKEIEMQAKLEVQVLQQLKYDVASAVDKYMKKEKIGFNELVRRLNVSPTHAAKIKRGEANLTLSSLAHIFALIGQKPNLVFSGKVTRSRKN